MFARIVAFLKSLLPFVADEAVKVAPHIQRQINDILKGAKLEADRVAAGKTVAAIKAKLEVDLKAVKEFAEQHIVLLNQAAEKQLAEATAVLPSVESQLAYTPSVPPPPPPAA